MTSDGVSTHTDTGADADWATGVRRAFHGKWWHPKCANTVTGLP